LLVCPQRAISQGPKRRRSEDIHREASRN
jgi:hypothetical protein